MPENVRKEIRYDHGELVLSKAKGGFRRYDVKIARAGVFPYVYQDGTIRKEAKLPEDLFSAATIDSAKGAPITEDHVPPSDSRGLVTPQNYKKYVKGALGDSITVQDGHICGAETLLDESLIAKVDAGEKVELSIGFELDIDPTPGEYKGERYDAIQRNIRINHVAHVDHGRAGETVRVQLDSVPQDVHIAIMQKGETMSKTPGAQVRADEGESKLSKLERLAKFFGFDSAEASPAEPAKKPADGAASVEELQKQVADLTQKLASAMEKIKELNKEAQLTPDHSEEAAMDAKIAKRTALRDAAQVIIPEVKIDGLSEREIKLKIIAQKLPFPEGTRQDSVSAERIDGQFEAALQLARREAADGGIGIDASQVKSDEKAITEGRAARAGRWDAEEKKRAERK